MYKLIYNYYDDILEKKAGKMSAVDQVKVFDFIDKLNKLMAYVNKQLKKAFQLYTTAKTIFLNIGVNKQDGIKFYYKKFNKNLNFKKNSLIHKMVSYIIAYMVEKANYFPTSYVLLNDGFNTLKDIQIFKFLRYISKLETAVSRIMDKY